MVCGIRLMGMGFACLSVVWCSCVPCHGDSSVQYFPCGRCPCSVPLCSDRGDSTGTVLGSVDDVPVVVQRQVQGQTVQKACWCRSCVRGRFPSWCRGRFPWSNCSVWPWTFPVAVHDGRLSLLSWLCRRHEARSHVMVGPCAQAQGRG